MRTAFMELQYYCMSTEAGTYSPRRGRSATTERAKYCGMLARVLQVSHTAQLGLGKLLSWYRTRRHGSVQPPQARSATELAPRLQPYPVK